MKPDPIYRWGTHLTNHLQIKTNYLFIYVCWHSVYLISFVEEFPNLFYLLFKFSRIIIIMNIDD